MRFTNVSLISDSNGKPMTTISVPATSLNRDRLFFTGMTAAMAVTAFAGFAPSFYLRSAAFQGPPLTPLVMMHGIVMTVWMLAAVLQSSLIAAGNRSLHRMLGWLFAALAILIVVTGPQVGLGTIRRGAVPPGLTPEQFFVLPMAGALMFAIFIGLGLWLRNSAQAHKRLMLLATISIMDAAVARMPGMFEAGPIAFFAGADAFIVAGVLYDFATRARVHAAWIWGGAAIVVSQALRLMLAGTETWASFVRYLVG
jgi:hypothetical protein